jgi:hypothetical protein
MNVNEGTAYQNEQDADEALVRRRYKVLSLMTKTEISYQKAHLPP